MLLSEENRNMIYTDYHDKVMRYISSKVSNPQDAEDLTSCVFAKVYRKLDSFDESKASISTWIYTVAKNTEVDYYRTRKPFEELPEDIAHDDPIDEKLINEETLELLGKALEQLDSRLRDLIILHYYEGMTLKIIAEKMNMSYTNAKVLHKKALNSLQKLLGGISK